MIHSIDEYIAKHREENFYRLWQLHQDIVRKSIFKLSFVNASNFDDYHQEAFIAAWQRYKYWYHNRDDFSIKLFLYYTARQSALKYRCRLLGLSTRYMTGGHLTKERVRLVESVGFFDKAYEIFENDKIESLHKAIEDLPPEERKAIRLFLDDEDLQGIALAESREKKYYTRRLRRAIRRIRSGYRLYFEDVKIDLKSLSDSNGDYSNPVNQFDINGNFLKRWSSIIEAQEIGGFDAYTISKVAKGQSFSYRGFRWAFEGGELRVWHPNRKRIAQIDKNGTVVHIWESASEAAREGGFMVSCISLCVRGKSTFHKGYRWAAVGNDPIKFEKLEGPLTGGAKGIIQLSETGEIVRVWRSLNEVKRAGYCQNALHQCLKGGREGYRGYKWQYAS